MRGAPKRANHALPSPLFSLLSTSPTFGSPLQSVHALPSPFFSLLSTVMSSIIAMDFDGVICDSAPENAATAWRCCCRLWPERFSMPMPAEQPARFCGELRPYMETGWQSIMQTYGLWKGVPLEDLTSGLAETLPKPPPGDAAAVSGRSAFRCQCPPNSPHASAVSCVHIWRQAGSRSCRRTASGRVSRWRI